ncbi:IS66 family transposase, partial [Xanthocytophaga flava]|uniref:IS66 family transposase n=1 Tax=Xanthocytophaga flava TaxID=3048013 RepID=UPI0028D87EAF
NQQQINQQQINQQQIKIGSLPERVIDKGIPGAGLLATILTDKYLDHLPLYRQKQRFARENIQIASSTIEGWTKEALLKLEPLYEQLVFHTKSKGYLQVDETPIKVLESEKKGACHQGWYWVYHAPLDGIVLFDYSPTRGSSAPLPILGNFKGYLQTDGYAVYEKYAASKQITHLACWAHARREFEKALDNDRPRAEKALLLIQQLYAVERKCREQKLSTEQIKQVRLEQSLPVLNELGQWIFEQIQSTLPKSQIGKAMAYAYARWDALSAYLYDGSLQIDNNLVENAIRPIALGRKNYLFAGSHQAAQRAAMIYSFFAICKKEDVNPFVWLKYTLENISCTNHKNLTDLFPQNYKRIILTNNM